MEVKTTEPDIRAMTYEQAIEHRTDLAVRIAQIDADLSNKNRTNDGARVNPREYHRWRHEQVSAKQALTSRLQAVNAHLATLRAQRRPVLQGPYFEALAAARAAITAAGGSRAAKEYATAEASLKAAIRHLEQARTHLVPDDEVFAFDTGPGLGDMNEPSIGGVLVSVEQAERMNAERREKEAR